MVCGLCQNLHFGFESARLKMISGERANMLELPVLWQKLNSMLMIILHNGCHWWAVGSPFVILGRASAALVCLQLIENVEINGD